MRKRRHIFWGVLILLGAAALVVSKLGYLQDMGFWSILFSVCLCGIFMDGLLKLRWGELLFSAAFFIILHDERLHLESLTPWTVLLVALLGTIGLSMLFPRRNRGHNHHAGGITGGHLIQGEWIDDKTITTEQGDVARFEVSFGDATKYVSSQELSEVKIENSFGEIAVYLTDAALKDHIGKVYVEVSFGHADIYVPASWNVVLDIETSFGSANTEGVCSPNGTEKLLIKGEVSFGDATIHYV